MTWVVLRRDRHRDILARLRFGHQRPLNRRCPDEKYQDVNNNRLTEYPGTPAWTPATSKSRVSNCRWTPVIYWSLVSESQSRQNISISSSSSQDPPHDINLMEISSQYTKDNFMQGEIQPNTGKLRKLEFWNFMSFFSFPMFGSIAKKMILL